MDFWVQKPNSENEDLIYSIKDLISIQISYHLMKAKKLKKILAKGK